MVDAAALRASLRPEIAGLRSSEIVEIWNYGKTRDGLIGLWIGEGDLPTPDFIGEAAMKALKDGHTFYTDQNGILPLREALSAYLEGLYGIDVGPERVTISVGGMGAIMMTMQALIAPGDEVIVLTPCWPNIFEACNIMGGRPVSVALDHGPTGWALDLDRLIEAIGPRTKALFINSPNNPTGYVMPRADMEKVVEVARSRDLWIVSDEVYGRMTYNAPRATSFLELTEPDERVVQVNTFSKNWSMTGWRTGWVRHPKALRTTYADLVQYNTSGVPTFLQYGALAALTEGEAHVQGLIERCREGRKIVLDALQGLGGVRMSAPDGTFYAYFAVDGEPDSMALARRLVDEANVGLAPGKAFGLGGEAYLRLCYGVSHDRLREACRRLVDVLG